MNNNIKPFLENGNNVQITLYLPEAKMIIEHFVTEAYDKIRKQLEESTSTDRLLTRQEVVDMLKVDSSTLWRWEKANYLCPVRVGGKVRYRGSDIEALINKESDHE